MKIICYKNHIVNAEQITHIEAKVSQYPYISLHFTNGEEELIHLHDATGAQDFMERIGLFMTGELKPVTKKLVLPDEYIKEWQGK